MPKYKVVGVLYAEILDGVYTQHLNGSTVEASAERAEEVGDRVLVSVDAKPEAEPEAVPVEDDDEPEPKAKPTRR